MRCAQMKTPTYICSTGQEGTVDLFTSQRTQIRNPYKATDSEVQTHCRLTALSADLANFVF